MWNTFLPGLYSTWPKITDVEYIFSRIVFHMAENYRCGIHFFLNCIPHGRKLSMWNTLALELYSTWLKIIDVEYIFTRIVFHMAKNFRCGIHLPRSVFHVMLGRPCLRQIPGSRENDTAAQPRHSPTKEQV